jgi:hypothetical protein
MFGTGSPGFRHPWMNGSPHDDGFGLIDQHSGTDRESGARERFRSQRHSTAAVPIERRSWLSVGER